MLQIHFLLYKLRFLYTGILGIAVSFSIIWILVSVLGLPVPAANNARGHNETSTTDMSDSSNAVTRGINTAMYQLDKMIDAAVRESNKDVQAIAAGISRTGNLVGSSIYQGTAAILRTVGGSFLFSFHTIGSFAMLVLRAPVNAYTFFTSGSIVNAVIRPADHNPVPTIDPKAPAVLAAKEALPATPVAQNAMPLELEPVWPIHGTVTTQFGVPEWPYQAVHTGLDISDGQPSGVTQIKSFRRGTVITAERSGGLGNHVVIDHGSGVSSVYGHLASISVKVGDVLETNTVVGYEGSTGVSTGPHLHFEIRVNGQATDPHQFINGQP